MVDEHEETARKSLRLRFTIRRMMVGIAIVAVIMVVSKTLCIDNEPRDFLFVAVSLLAGRHSTIYAGRYSESSFRTIRVGMPTREVEVIMGPPLYKGQWIVGIPGQPVLLDGPRDDYWSSYISGTVPECNTETKSERFLSNTSRDTTKTSITQCLHMDICMR